MILQWLTAPSRPKVFAVALLWLMVVLVVGTLAQAKVGLYQSYHMYFATWMIWLGPLPLPGTQSVLALMAYGLGLKLLREPFKLAHLGSWLSHAGVLLLLLGGLATFLVSTEGYLNLRPNQTVHASNDYYAAQLTLRHVKSAQITATLPTQNLKPGLYTLGPLVLSVSQSFTNTRLVRRPETENTENALGMHRIFNLAEAPPELDAELNTAGIQFHIQSGTDQAGKSLALIENAPIPQPLTISGTAYQITLDPQQKPLPFGVTLNTFTRTLHPGTGTASAYRSDVTITDGAHTFPAVIEMNRPLRYKGYTLYQSSFTADDEGETSVLAVVENKARMFPYLAGAIMAMGLLVQFIRRLKVNPKTLVLIALCMVSQSGFAQHNLTAFAQLPIQHEGRLKPLDTFARSILQSVAESETAGSQPAIAWLAQAVFNPAQAPPVIRIRNPDAVALLGLPARRPAMYGLAEVIAAFQTKAGQLEAALNQPENMLTPAERDVKSAYTKAQVVFDITHSLSVVQPRFTVTHPQLARTLGVSASLPLTYQQVLQVQPRLLPVLQAVHKSTSLPTAMEQEAILLAAAMRAMDADRSTQLLRVLPPAAGSAEWQSPWMTPLTDLGAWQNLVQVYTQQPEAFEAAVTRHASTLPIAQPWKLRLEYRLNTLRIWHVITGLYGVALLLGVAAAMQLRTHRAGLLTFTLAVLVHGGGLVARSLILERPPVATLYESILFVGLTATLAAMLVEWKRRDNLLLVLGSLMGVLLMLVALSYGREGDTMGMLQAVLNTRFWLATHVLTITLGYGTCLLAGGLAHLYLFRLWHDLRGFPPYEHSSSWRRRPPSTDVRRLKKQSAKREQGSELTAKHLSSALQLTSIATLMNQTFMLGLALTAFGTYLGGVWADQSWGRFWGWDPKENGALLIVLWLTFTLHARIARWPAVLVGARGTAIGLILNNIVVAVAWFGVNLLNVGLHSYGFTQGIALGLGAFCASQFIAALALGYLTRPHPRH